MVHFPRVLNQGLRQCAPQQDTRHNMPTNDIAGPVMGAPVDRMILRVDNVRPGGVGTGDTIPLNEYRGSLCCFEDSYDE